MSRRAIDPGRCPARWLAPALALAVSACMSAVAPSGSAAPAPSELPSRSAAPTPLEGPAIAFHADPDGNDDFYLIGADGGGLRPLTRMAETVAFPYWSPDGSKIAYLCCTGHDSSLWVMNADGSGSRRLTTGLASSPAWSPDGSRIAYDDHGAGAIWSIAADGSDAKRLALASGGGRWSPDGSSIVFFSWRDFPGQEQRNELYVIAADGSNQVRLTHNDAEDVEPTWSPDGSRILFTSYRNGADPLMLGSGNAEVFTVRPDGSAPTNLTNDPDWDGYPAWSPDGRQIAFSINNGVEFDLYVMNADGTARRRLPGVAGANGIANDCCPAWRP